MADVSKLAIANNIKAPLNAVTYKLAEIDENGSLDEFRMELKVSVTNASLKQPGKAKWKRELQTYGNLIDMPGLKRRGTA